MSHCARPYLPRTLLAKEAVLAVCYEVLLLEHVKRKKEKANIGISCKLALYLTIPERVSSTAL